MVAATILSLVVSWDDLRFFRRAYDLEAM